jgi:hypothetical protein
MMLAVQYEDSINGVLKKEYLSVSPHPDSSAAQNIGRPSHDLNREAVETDRGDRPFSML